MILKGRIRIHKNQNGPITLKISEKYHILRHKAPCTCGFSMRMISPVCGTTTKENSASILSLRNLPQYGTEQYNLYKVIEILP
jgi:hypothetical protein